MKLQSIYKRDIEKELNPVVSVSDYTAETVETEISEYVFTDEIIHYLYTVLNAIREGNYHQNGIWINGYFGSGKSHFTKYLNYCLQTAYREKALARLEDAVIERDPLVHPDSNSGVEPSEIRSLMDWLKKNTIETVLFNIGDKVTGDERDDNNSFTRAIWQEFNRFRGYNRENIALAQYLEKPLAEKGKFETFKQLMDEEGFDWEKESQQLATTELDYVMEIAAQAEPSLSYDIIRDNIAKNNISLSVENLTKELNAYVQTRGEDYRLLFFIDEVSMFVGGKRQLLLQLQQIVVRIQEDCNGRVWVGCSAQQDLSELLTNMQVNETSDDYGQIKGRFPIKVALKGTNTEFVTKKRVLDKKEQYLSDIQKLYDDNKNAISAQFILPTSYNGYADKDSFVSYYPFVPYQFQLIIQVFDAFVEKQFVDKEVKGNERSVLKITHNTAYRTRDEELGKFIAFDQFYSAMFEAGLQPAGQRAIRNAERTATHYSQDPDFAARVVKVLFMICNIKETDRLVFPATVDNVVTLLMTDIDQNRLELKQKVERVLDFLKKENIIRLQLGKDGAPDVYAFYSEEESDVARIIATKRPDSSFMGEQFSKLFQKFISFSNKEGYCGNNFSVGLSILGRNIFGNNPDVQVEFVLYADTLDANQYAFTYNKDQRRLVFFLAADYKESRVDTDFYWYCQVQDYLRTASNDSPQRQKANRAFAEQAQEVMKTRIERQIREIFDRSPVMSGQNILSSAELGMKKGNERYKAAVQAHLGEIYTYAKAVYTPDYPTNSNELKAKILNPQLEADMTPPEQWVENYLVGLHHDVSLTEVVQKFTQAPYGWNEVSTLFVVSKLVTRHKRAFLYNNNPAVDRRTVAENIQKNKNLFTITTAQDIPQETVNNFITAWKSIFNRVESMPSDPTELFEHCRKSEKSPIVNNDYDNRARKLISAGANTMAQVLYDAIEKMKEWREVRDPKAFFQLFIDNEQEMKVMIDNCKRVIGFCEDQLGKFSEITAFIQHNHDNFDFLEGDAHEMAEELKKLTTEAWPIDKMPKYNKLKRNVEGAIGEVRAKMVADVTAAYEDCFAQLQALIESLGIPEFRLPNKETTIYSRTHTESLHAMKNYADTTEFFNAQVQAINKYAEEKNKPKVHNVSLRTKSKTMRTESDVDAYLAQLKQQIMSHINGKDDVIIQ